MDWQELVWMLALGALTVLVSWGVDRWKKNNEWEDQG